MRYIVQPRVNPESNSWRFYLDVQPPVGPAAAASLAEALPHEQSQDSNLRLKRIIIGHEDKDGTVFTVNYGTANGEAEDIPPQLEDPAFCEFMTGAARTLVELTGVQREVFDPVAAQDVTYRQS